jgi:long-chain fatty acid transport protein
MRGPLAALLAAGTLVAGASVAQATPLPEMIGATGGSGGFNARVTGASAASTYFNPALLPDAHETFTLDFFVIGTSLDITPRARPAEANVGASIDDAWQPDSMGGIKPLRDRPLATADLAAPQSAGSGSATNAYVGVGLVKQLAGPRLTFGMQVLLPAGDFQRQAAFFSDEREQYFSNSLHFEMLGDRLTLSTIVLGLGSRLTDELSIGVGFSMGIATSVTSPVYVPDAADYSVVFLDNDLSVSSKLAPHGGIVYRPIPNLSLSATMHAPFRVEVKGKNVVRVGNQEPVDQVFSFVNGDEPFGAALAAAYALSEDGSGLGFVATGTWRKWSDYEDRHGEAPLAGWKDTFSVAAGARYGLPGYTIYLDGVWVPSPVPDQDGRENYVDNDRVGGAAGMTADVTIFGRRYRGSVNLDVQRLLARSVAKRADAEFPVTDEFPDNSVNTSLQPLPESQGFQSNNPGYPGYSSAGWLVGAGLSLETWF